MAQLRISSEFEDRRKVSLANKLIRSIEEFDEDANHYRIAQRMTLGIASQERWANEARYQLARQIRAAAELSATHNDGDKPFKVPYGMDQLIRCRGDVTAALSDQTLPIDYVKSLGFSEQAYDLHDGLRADVIRQFEQARTVLADRYLIDGHSENIGNNFIAPTISSPGLPNVFRGDGKFQDASPSMHVVQGWLVLQDVIQRLPDVEDRLFLDIQGHSSEANGKRVERATEVLLSIHVLQENTFTEWSYDTPYGLDVLVRNDGDVKAAINDPKLKLDLAREWAIRPYEVNEPWAQADLNLALQRATKKINLDHVQDQVEPTPREARVETSTVKATISDSEHLMRITNAQKLYSEVSRGKWDFAHKLSLGIPSDSQWANDMRRDLAQHVAQSVSYLQQHSDDPGQYPMPFGIEQLLRHDGDVARAVKDPEIHEEFARSIGYSADQFAERGSIEDVITSESSYLKDFYNIDLTGKSSDHAFIEPTLVQNVPKEFFGAKKLFDENNQQLDRYASSLITYNDVTQRMNTIEERLMLEIQDPTSSGDKHRLKMALRVRAATTYLQDYSMTPDSYPLPREIEALIRAQGNLQSARQELKDATNHPNQTESSLSLSPQPGSARDAKPIRKVVKSASTLFPTPVAARVRQKPNQVTTTNDGLHREPPPYVGPHYGGPTI